MTTSGSVNFSINRNEICEDALREIGRLADGQVMSANDLDFCSRRLNLLVKQWQGTADFAPGLKEWSRKRGYVFLQKAQSVYSLGPSGDAATSSYSQTTLSAPEAGGQTALSVTSNTGMTAADYIGIVLDSGYFHWTTIVSTGGGPIVTVTAALPTAAAAGNAVFWFTTKMRRPIDILTQVIRDTNGTDTTLGRFRTISEYESIPDKSAAGDPTTIYYERQLVNGVLYLDNAPNDVSKIIRVVFLSDIEDFDALADTPDYPAEWYLPLVLGLAKNISPRFGLNFTALMQDNYTSSLAIARNVYPEVTDVSFQPNAPE